MNYLLVILYFISLLISIQGGLEKVPAGHEFVRKVSSGTIKFLGWRASANIREELSGIKNLFGWTAIALFLSFFIFGEDLQKNITSNVLRLSLLCLVIWYSFSSFLDVKKKIAEWSTPVALMVSMPWFYAFILKVGGGDPGFFSFFSPAFELFNISLNSVYQQALIISLLLFVVALIYFAVTMLILLIVPAVIYALLKLTTLISRRWGAEIPRWLYSFFLVYYVIVTMYFFSKGAQLP